MKNKIPSGCIRFTRWLWLFAVSIGAWNSFSARAQAILSQTVMVDSAGMLLSPTNFWTMNSAGLNAALSSTTNLVSLSQWAGFTNQLISLVNTRPSGPFSLTFSNLTVRVDPGSILWPDGSQLVFPGGTLGLVPNFTNYLVLNYGTGRLHTLYRFLGGGGEHLLAVVVTGSDGVVGNPLVNTDFTGLPTRIPGARSRLLGGASRFDVVLMGDSTTEASGTGVMWKDLLFSSSTASSGWNVPHAASVVVRNFGLGGANADYGLALMSRSAQSFGYPFQGYGGHGTPLDFAGVPAGTASRTWTPQAGYSRLFNPMPDLVLIGFGINASVPQSDSYASVDLETVGRNWQALGVPVLYLTENDFAGAPMSLASLAGVVSQLAVSVGGAVADTAAYVDERNRLGTSTYVDAIHSNQAGWNAWAEAILGVLNPWPQAPLTVQPVAHRVIDPPVASEAPYIGTGATWVSGTAISRSAGVTVTTTSGGVSTNYLPSAFGATLVHSVPGSTGGINYVDYYHSCWSSASLIFERGIGANGVGTNSFAGYSAWLDHNGAEQRMRTIRFVDDNQPGIAGPFQRPGMLELASVTEVLPAISNLTAAGLSAGPGVGGWNHGALRIAITNGNARILGVLFRGPRHEKIPLGRGGAPWMLGPSWFDDVGDPYGWYPHLLSTDSQGDTLGIRFHGRGLQLTLRRSTAAGQIAVYGNGTLLQTQDLYAQGRPPWILQWLPAGPSGGDLPVGDAASEWMLTYLGDNPARVTSSYGYHAVCFFDALVIY